MLFPVTTDVVYLKKFIRTFATAHTPSAVRSYRLAAQPPAIFGANDPVLSIVGCLDPNPIVRIDAPFAF